MNVSHYVGLKFEQIDEQFRKYDSNLMECLLGADAGAGTKPAELRSEIPPDVDFRTEVMEVTVECVMTAFHTLRSAETQGMGYILRTGIRMYIIGVS